MTTTAPTSQDLKQTLVSYIEAYAAAKASGNEVLIRLSAGPLQTFLTQYDLIDVTAVSSDSEE